MSLEYCEVHEESRIPLGKDFVCYRTVCTCSLLVDLART